MPSLIAPTESVTRHRGSGRDENGELITEASPVTLLAFGVAPGGGSDKTSLARTGETIECTVYFPAGTDIANGDELTVRGKRFQIVVNDWQIQGSAGGIEAHCVRGEG